jgi:leucyl aminopeptidase (aminopeptidase T)
LSEAEPDPYGAVISFRATERAKMLAAMSELIEDAQKRTKSHNTLSRERPKWANLAGKLIWYRDQILRSMNYEALWKEMQAMRELIETRIKERSQTSEKGKYVDMSTFQQKKK